MNDMNFTQSELLIAYMDGELEQAQELGLFSALTESSELRTEMRDLLAMRRAIKEDRVAFTPPLAATAAIFGTLGLSAPALLSSGWWSALWSKAGISLTSALVGSAITWFGMSTFSSANEQSAATTLPATTQQYATEQGSPTPTAVSATSSAAAEAGKEEAIVRPVQAQRQVITKYVYVPVADADASQPNATLVLNTITNETPKNQTPEQNSSVVQSMGNKNTKTATLQSEEPPTKPEDIVVQEPAVSMALSPFLVRRIGADMSGSASDVAALAHAPAGEDIKPETYPQPVFHVRGLAGKSLVDVPVAAPSGLGFNNIAVGFSYVLGPNFSVGPEFGREPIAMQFQGKDSGNGQMLRYEAHPSLFWYGLALQYRFGVARNTTMFLQPSLSGTSYGPLGKFITGLQYSPVSSLRLMIGIEASNLWYNYQEKTYTTPKIGFTYGLLYRF